MQDVQVLEGKNLFLGVVQMVVMAARVVMSFFVSIPILIPLVNFRNQKYLIAKNGQSGAGNKKTGQDAEDLIVMVPKGTVIFDSISNKLIYDCCDEGIDYLVAKGGDGGAGNFRFKSSTNQAPRRHTAGWPGDEFSIRLELRSLADVGLVGFPNAGKSTFLNSVSAARPKDWRLSFYNSPPQFRHCSNL